ncbi:hypothetical protein [Pelagimonas phthalicica]|uniref:hypothetical protein n=1 Tax=Pelagimonas phthalicica TaxID=1037362 RepID=UPI000C077EC6|nr:hypothetical protein [Pelagimonas phthalicica]
MFRILLPVALCLSSPVFAQTLSVPGISKPSAEVKPTCQNIPYSQENCVRVLACVGASGLYFDGRALGWDQGKVIGALSNGTRCVGTWKSGGFMGTGTSTLSCQDGTQAQVLYYTQDNDTGTVTGRGSDNHARAVIAWSGQNVLEFLTPSGKPSAELPCGPTAIPIS